jgi:broad specificity phosphatase PhoE
MKKYFSILVLLFIFQLAYGQDNESTRIYIIRHAEKEKDGSNDPMLTAKGEKRALYWAEVFKNIDFDAVYSTKTLRTTATALPSAIQSGIQITPYETNNINLFSLIEKHKGKSILIVGHSNTIPTLVNTLIGKESFSEIERFNNSNLYIVDAFGTDYNASLLFIEFSP